MATSLISLNSVQLAFGHHPLLNNADLIIQTGERIGLIGRNGAGKSSLLKLIQGTLQPDDGEIQRQGGLRVATVEQEPDLNDDQSIFEFLTGNYLEEEDWQKPARANIFIDQLGLQADSKIKGLSGGMRKRVALAHALTNEPDLLLLDEPTNHLDFEGIKWLESLIANTRCSVIIITHDRRFLDTIATRIIELDRGKILSFPGNYSIWQERKAEWLAAEAQQAEKADKFLAQEEVWIRTGVQARRTRDEGRVRRLEQLRRDRAARRERQGNVSLAVDQGQRSGRLVAELDQINHGYGSKVLIKNFSATILRKDRIGLIGPNGSGKTTLLKIILGLLEPQSGTVKLGTNLNIGYFDQMRAQLDENATVAETINPGSEWVEIGNQRKHVMSYLADFLFEPQRAQSPVKVLSGGERARLALARMFAQPVNILVLDEPTNDLDIETLELLEELLQEYDGTVLLVSHDREFLNNVVTQTIVAQGNGHWQEYVGGYDDWIQQQAEEAAQQIEPSPATEPAKNNNAATATNTKAASTSSTKPKSAGRITSWEQRELDELPAKISAIETEQAEIAQQLSDPQIYKDQPDQVDALNTRSQALEVELNQLFERWEELEDKANAT